MARQILLVDDDLAVRRVVTKVLTRAGYGVVAVGSAEEALAHLESDASAALVVTDLVMAEMNGDELAEAIRRRWPTIKCLIMSGQPTEPTSSVSERLLKPFESAELLEAVARLLATHA